VVVIGAGVIGLQTALTLLRAGYAVSVIAEFWPGDEDGMYTSPWYVHSAFKKLRYRLYISVSWHSS
jgi:glycine/D-amino acid oxidase-like deaminating enzyme